MLRSYNINWIYGTAVSVSLYYVLNVVFPHSVTLLSGVTDVENISSMTDESTLEYGKEPNSINREVKADVQG